MALILSAGTKIRGATLSDGYAKIDSVTISNGIATAVLSIYASKAERQAGTRPMDTVIMNFSAQALPRGTGAGASVVGDFYDLINLSSSLAGSYDDQEELE